MTLSVVRPRPAAIDRSLRGAVVALGNFDGFHVGHQAVVGRALARARAEGRPALVATFDPHPVRLFRPDDAPFLLTSVAERSRLFTQFGVDGTAVIPFDREIAALPPERFVAHWLREWLGAAAVVTGSDFRFGRGRAGDHEALAAIGARHGIATDAVTPVRVGPEIVSSTRVRRLLAAGDTAAATRLLGRPHRIDGVVRTRTVHGCVTASLALGERMTPRVGNYAARALTDDGRWIEGVARVGTDTGFDPGEACIELRFPVPAGALHARRIAVELRAFLPPRTTSAAGQREDLGHPLAIAI